MKGNFNYMSGLKRYRTAVSLFIAVFVTAIIVYLVQPDGSYSRAHVSNVPVGSGPVTGLLGNTPVRIPEEYARLIEYDENPALTVQRVTNNSLQTGQSRIRSFGFETHFPEMASKKEASHASGNSYGGDWLDVTVISNEYYGTLDNMEREVSSLIAGEFNHFKFSRMPKPIFGTESYIPVDVGERREKTAGSIDMQDYNIYVYRGNDGHVEVYVTCINGEHASSPCTMRFLIPEPMKARVTIRFRRDQLGSWNEIRKSTLKLIQSFALNTIK